jgi:hypothetical protein
MGADGEPTGIKVPYIVTLEEGHLEKFYLSKETGKQR